MSTVSGSAQCDGIVVYNHSHYANIVKVFVLVSELSVSVFFTFQVAGHQQTLLLKIILIFKNALLT